MSNLAAWLSLQYLLIKQLVQYVIVIAALSVAVWAFMLDTLLLVTKGSNSMSMLLRRAFCTKLRSQFQNVVR